MARFNQHDTVVIRRLNAAVRELDGTSGARRQPVVGDECAIVHVLSEDKFIVECVDDAGATVWLADFDANELAVPPGGWHFTLEEVSPGAYHARGAGPAGANAAATDTDPVLALAACRRFALDQVTSTSEAGRERG